MANANYTLGIDRRRLLTSAAAAATAAGVVPRSITTEPSQIVDQMRTVTPSEVSPNSSAATVRRLAEIARRNLIRVEAKLPPLSVATELRKMYRRDRQAAFERFAADHKAAVRDKLLAVHRQASGDAI